MALGLHGQHRHPHKGQRKGNRPTTPRVTPSLHPPHATQARTKRPLSKTQEMQL